MAVYRLTRDAITELPKTSYAQNQFRERDDLQRLLRQNIQVVAPDVLVIAEEFGQWDDSKRRIDLLGIDHNGTLVVIELKRDEEGGHMELQAIRYAAMVSRMTFQRAIKTYQDSLDRAHAAVDARASLLEWIRIEEPLRDDSVLDVRIVLVAADFQKELTTAVLWLREWDLDIRCVRVKPYQDVDALILEVQQVVPLPEAAEYQVSIRDEAVSRREVAREQGEPTGYWFMNVGEDEGGTRAWEDCRRYGFLSAGGNEQYQRYVRSLKPGNKVFAYLSGHGYVGLCEIVAEAVPQRDFVPQGETRRLPDLPLRATLLASRLDDLTRCDWCAAVRWIESRDREGAVLRHRARRSTLQSIRQPALVEELLMAFGQTGAAI